MKKRLSRTEDVRRAIIHEERSSAPPDIDGANYARDNSCGSIGDESKNDAHLFGPDMGKEVND